MIKTIAILLVMLVVNFLMILSVSRAAKRVDYSLRKYFVQRLGHDDLGADLPENRIIEEIRTEKAPEANDFALPKSKTRQQVILSSNDAVGRANYKNDTLKEDYKAIRKISGYTPEHALACAKAQIRKDADARSFKDYIGLYNMLDYDTVYSMNVLDPEKQEALLRTALKDDHAEILSEFLEENGNRFDCIEFYGYLEQMAAIYNSDFTVVTGNEEDCGRKLKDGTEISFDDRICEGSQVIYKNKMYDFSI